MKKVAIIGGGSSGLTAAKACVEAGLNPTVFERDVRFGGLWKTGSGGRVWTSMKTNLSKHTCCFSDFRWPEDAPTFPSCDQVRQYLEDYAVHFDLVRYVRFGHEVTAAAPSKSGGWEVTFVSNSVADDGSVEMAPETTEEFDKCIVASGIFVTSYFPPPGKVKGITDAVETGWATHSATYRDPEEYSGQSVLVVGGAFSGSEIACGMAGTVGKCVVATGGALVFLPRVISMPMPEQEKQPSGLADAPSGRAGAEEGGGSGSARSASLGERLADVNTGGVSSALPKEASTGGRDDHCCHENGNHTDPVSATYGTPLDLTLYTLKAAASTKANVSPLAEKREQTRVYCLELAGRDPGDVDEALRLESGPNVLTNISISDQFLNKVRDGSIEVRPRLISLDAQAKEAHFSDGTSEHVDHVICCTGLRPQIGFLPSKILELIEFEESDPIQPLVLHIQTWTPCVPNLAFVGVYRSPHFGVVELQARWVTRMWSGAVPPPTAETCAAGLQARRDVRNARPRPQFSMGYLEIMEALAEVAGLVPPQDWSAYAGGGSPFIQEATASASFLGGAMGLNGALPGVGTQASTASDDCCEPVNGVHAADADANRASTAQHRAEMSLFTEALTELSPDGNEEKAMLMLKEWLWSGPLLPCHYRIREFLAHGTAVALGDAVREMKDVNTKYPGYVKV